MKKRSKKQRAAFAKMRAGLARWKRKNGKTTHKKKRRTRPARPRRPRHAPKRRRSSSSGAGPVLVIIEE